MIWQRLIDALFPPRCVGCGVRGAWLCGDCVERAARAPVPVTRPAGSIDAVSSAHAFDGVVREAIHRLKYGRSRHLAEPLARLLDEAYAELEPHLPSTPDLIVPVPLHPRRIAQRGYNQSELVAVRMSLTATVPVSTVALRRVRDTPAQTRLGAAQRRLNLRDAFVADTRVVAGRRVLLVDDVTTTGATMTECASALRAAGAASVAGVTIARAL